ncbi:hypothetical protein KO494_04195 [Lacinutrix sp. C3R15]|uniref:hypothetical protein n=1 Tax=Flavobacteriaceae TaxID=49546 RepID=UPI001C0974E6|nr:MULTISPECIES: hypothetical protein [Flavobacteriaceae]MBU2938737.1 hypothetical protein [Lacinutrix sp. C3R15]MDO6622050.1 hypothetical protein [Oceanihabitans sp. 1_MG-2023]
MRQSILIIILLISFSASAQNDPNEVVEQFFKEFKEKGAAIAIDNLYKPNKWINKSADAIIQLKSQLEGLNEDFVGKYYGKELILEKKLADSFILKSYLVKYDRQPIRFTFQFYKPNDTWMIQSFKFDGNLDTEIEEAAKLYNFTLN